MKQILITVLAMFALINGCKNSGSSNVPSSPNSRIKEARKAVEKMIAKVGRVGSVGISERILNEPDFTGPLKEWGAIVSFDRQGNIIKAITLKKVDFKTGKKFKVRLYTEQEIAQSKTQILKRRAELGIPKNMTFPIISESLKLAVAEYVLNENELKTYTIGRGSGSTKEELQVTEISFGRSKVIAADALYHSSQ